MATVRAESLVGLERAAADEGRAASRLADALRGTADAMNSLDTAALEASLAHARACADALSQTANARAALTRMAARALGLRETASFGDVLRALGPDGIDALARAAETLERGLEEAGREAAAQALAARYGAGLWAHRVGLVGAAGSEVAYGPGGRIRPPSARAGRCA